MTELYIEGHKVIIESKDIKVTCENPFFSSSGEYTLEVELPLNNYINKQVFGSIDRFEVSKHSKKYEARLIADNIAVINGTATLTQVTEKSVKIQLFGGNSAVNFEANIEKVYIDEIDYGELDFTKVQGDLTVTTWAGVRKSDGELAKNKVSRILAIWDSSRIAYCGNINQFMMMPIYDETNETVKNLTGLYIGDNVRAHTGGMAVQPNLFYVIRKVIEHFGYRLTKNELDTEPWNRIFIANARASMLMGDCLPHWTVTDFLKEVEYFFNCTFVFSSKTKTAEIITNKNYFRQDIQSYPAEDTYSCELLGDDDEPEKNIASSNLKYDVSDSDEHKYDTLSDEIRLGYKHKKYSSRSEMVTAITAMGNADRRKYIFDCPEGSFVWATDGDTVDNDYDTGHFGPGRRDSAPAATSESEWHIKQVDQFGALVRDEKSDDYLELKICPVAMTIEQTVNVFQIKKDGNTSNHGGRYDLIAKCSAQMPCMQNPAGDDCSQRHSTCVWSAIIGEEDLEKQEDKEDRIQVFFVGDMLQYINKEGAAQDKKLPFPMVFTDYIDKAVSFDGYQNQHESWSMSLRQCGANAYIGQLHDIDISFNVKAEMQITFLSNRLPDIRKLFMFRNKKYVCKKYEVNITSNGIDNIIKGYFYEML